MNTTKKLLNDQYAVALRVTHERQSKYFAFSTLFTNQSIKWRCTLNDWKPATDEDNGFGKFRKIYKGFKECNALIELKLTEANKILNRYDDENITFSFELFEADLKRKDKPLITSLHDYYTLQITILEQQGRVGLAGLCFEVQRILKKFRPDALLSEVNFRFLESFEYWMRNERRNKDTTIT